MKNALKDKVDELGRQGFSYGEAEKKATAWIKFQAALHNSDQIAGGNPLNIGGLGDRRINSSLGSQWKSRIKDLDEKIRDMAKNMREAERKGTHLNIKLTN
ncbi:hypothetical protein KPL47_24690 [Clostridium estertheticum]|uniref:polymorphic toxin type 15 domain-containing protein n=1 Tax=Clostridium estertheticum TaxID=238834 RepID=UPI001C0D509B|nr:polymorphic toxin type 15 domain-containing protein [Clostridium estertheticum]MBU3179471.1 hypothetical protein [Clostridium estertheticum]